jgi:hypothetical protein
MEELDVLPVAIKPTARNSGDAMYTQASSVHAVRQ